MLTEAEDLSIIGSKLLPFFLGHQLQDHERHYLFVQKYHYF